MIARKVVCRMTKREARAWAKARRAELDMAAVGRGMAQALFSLPQWQSAGAVLAFAAMPDEPDTAEILRRALADGKRLLLPRVRSKTEMEWVVFLEQSQRLNASPTYFTGRTIIHI